MGNGATKRYRAARPAVAKARNAVRADDYIGLSYATSMANIAQGLKRNRDRRGS